MKWRRTSVPRPPNPGPPEIRRATPGDAHTIAAIAVASWQAAYRGILPARYLDRLSVEARATAWHDALSQSPALPVWIAERGGAAIGFASSGPPRDDDLPRDVVEVYAIYVLPDSWRSGAGRALLDAAVADAWQRGASAAVLWVLEANARGRRFYEAMGWRPDGRTQLIELGGAAVTELRYRLERPVPASSGGVSSAG